MEQGIRDVWRSSPRRMKNADLAMQLSRRRFLKVGAFVAMALLSPTRVMARIGPFKGTEKTLSFYNLHTEESLHKTYFSKGRYIPKVLSDINYILRDFRAGDVRPIDVKLLDLLYDIKCRLGTKDPFLVISGYRSPATNRYLREHSSGVACKSMHMFGKAIDIRLPSIALETLHKVAVALRRGGVGYYPESNFVHVDVGNVRYW
ncbi:MAG: DUF882 domain-containing protein [Dissulfurimicrobium sp.]|uniref:YcbK family protein n=1 Tax=Dissulfurimicrobium TaxID=1769732 RepID=UPI001EDA9EE2|nr:YcbK family protein [Dissulfurimicrobium hydrothermale]UKL13152.1 DUF882 domain-containing protein [Dissulfurimicrobium hydrothermale]